MTLAQLFGESYENLFRHSIVLWMDRKRLIIIKIVFIRFEKTLLTCNLVIKNCESVNCINGGFCDPDSIKCNCPAGFNGLKCENGKIFQ